ncbi:transcriptional regulator [Mesorhizobium albiziae]|nr:transcriptional regulator [Mesorhizobium albiziae]
MLFTDIEGSTKLVDAYGDAYPQLLSRHNELLRDAIHAYGGEEVNAVGDQVFALFPASSQGLQAAIDAQYAIDKEKWVEGCKLRVRMGLHAGRVQRHEAAVMGIEVHRAARISSVAHGGQIVISHVVRDDIRKSSLRPGVEIRDLGFHRLKDLRYPEALFDLVVPGLSSEFAPISSISANRTNLSFEQTRFYGRGEESRQIKDAILQKRHRLLTLTGAGGSGKTSLALVVGRDLVDSFARGVFLVQLGHVNSPDLIASAICQTLGIQELAGISAVESIRNTIGDGEVLLILDTFEHVIAGTPTVTQLLNSCPNLSILVTSREALNLRAETEIVVGPLPVPKEAAAFEEIAGSPSVQLFVKLAQRERPDFELTAKRAAEIARICQRLDGLPLALELAASHVGVLEPSELAQRLASKLQDLRHKSRDVDPRHRTLRATIEWSDNLLTEEQRRAFRELSVFVGGFGVAEAEYIANEKYEEVLDHIESLLAKSLIVRSTELGRPRFYLLDTIREYANEGLRRSDDHFACQERHARYYADLAAAAAPNVLRYNQRDYVEKLFQETGNIRAALQWLAEQPSARESARLLRSLKWFWISRGQFSEAKRWMESALLQVRRLDEPESLAAVLDTAGWVSYMSGDAESAQEFSVESHQLFLQLGSQAGIASSGIIAGIAKTIAGETEDGPKLIFDSLERFKTLGDSYGTVVALIAIGEGARAEGEEATAEQHYEEALRLLEGLGDTYWPGHLLQNLAHFRLHQGDWKAAAKFASEALAISERYDYPMVVNLAIAAMSGVLLAKGEATSSARLIGAVDARLGRFGAQFEPTDNADFQRIVSMARATLGDKRFSAAAARGATASWEDILKVARSYQ